MAIRDTGRDTFERYLYQAQITFRFCLDLARDKSEVQFVLPEWIEDIAVQHLSFLRMIQVKTRDLASQGTWRLSHLLGDAGAMLGLLQSHRTVREMGLAHRLDLYLEGPIAKTDPWICRLSAEKPAEDVELVSRIAASLGIGNDESRELLADFRLFPNQDSRKSVRAENLRLLGSLIGGQSFTFISSLYDRMLSIVIKAMCGRIDDPGEAAAESLRTISSEARLAKDGKCITKGHLSELTSLLPDINNELAREITSGNGSKLIEKLMLGGAPKETVGSAMAVRALTLTRALEESSLLHNVVFSTERILLRKRLGILTKSVVETISHSRPAELIFAKLMEIIAQQSHTLDSAGIYRGDPMLLLGEVCLMSDDCVSGWGTAGV